MNLFFRILLFVCAIASESLAHSITVQKSPTNEGGIVWGVSGASGFSRWRAYIRGVSNNAQGHNTGWKDSGNGWWYYDINSIHNQVMYRTTGLENQQFELTYWVFRSDGSWEFGDKALVRHDARVPTSSIQAPYEDQVVSGEDPRLRITASDESGIEWIRVYLWSEEYYNPSDWKRHDSKTIYKDFYTNSVDYRFSNMIPDLYVATVWVKDKAGNVAYEPWGRLEFWYEEEDDTDVDVPPVYEEPQPEEEPEIEMEEDVDEVVYEEPQEDSEGFIYPVDTDHVYRWENDIPDTAWYDYQPFGSLFAYEDKHHLGADLNKGGGDYGQPVYAVNDCVIDDFNDTDSKNAWGKWILLECNAPQGYDFSGNTSRTHDQVFPFYAHLKEIRIETGDTILRASQIEKGVTRVRKGWKIGSVGDANGYYQGASHLHFEIRTDRDAPVPGKAYVATDDELLQGAYIDPMTFIALNTDLWNETYTTLVQPFHTKYRYGRGLHLEGDWKMVGRTSSLPRGSMGYGNVVWKVRSSADAVATYTFEVGDTGLYDVYVYVPREHATATHVEYALDHDDEDFENPYRFVLNQSTSPGENERRYVGTFWFDERDSYDMRVQGVDEDTRTYITLDALEVVSSDGQGIGGQESVESEENEAISDNDDSSSQMVTQYVPLGCTAGAAGDSSWLVFLLCMYGSFVYLSRRYR
jgi:murein DD-endopeptidase MepM/ murein hydrolase activator NlpD